MSTYTPSLGLELITPGSQAGLWGNTTNNSLNLIDQAITGVTPISFAAASGTTYTLTDFNGAEDEARAAVLNVTGAAIGSNTVVIPNKQKTYLVRNNTGQDVVFQTASPSASYTVGAGYSILIFCDGNNNVFTGIASPGVGTLSVNAGGTGATTFTAGFIKSTGGTNALTSASTVNLASEVTGALPVANGGTGATSLTSGSLLIGNGTGAVASLSGGVVGYVATWNGSTWVSSAPTASGVTNVTALSPLNSSGGSTPQISLTGVVSTANGGTGASSLTGAGIVTTGDTQSISGAKTFSSTTFNSTATFNSTVNFNGTTTSLAWNMTSNTSMYYYSPDQNIKWAIGGSTLMMLGPAGNFQIAGSLAYKASGSTWDNPSDVRLKENIQDYTKGLTELVQINPKTWTFNGKGGSTSGLKGLGVIADEVESVIPDSVKLYKAKMNPDDATETDIKRFNADEIIWILVNSVKQLKAEVDALKAAK